MQQDSEDISIPDVHVGTPRSFLTKTDYLLLFFYRIAVITYSGINPFTYLIPMTEFFALFYKFCGWEKEGFFYEDVMPYIVYGMALRLAYDNLKTYGGLALKKEFEIIKKRQAENKTEEKQQKNRKKSKSQNEQNLPLILNIEDRLPEDLLREQFEKATPEAQKIFAAAMSDDEPIEVSSLKQTPSNQVSNNSITKTNESYWTILGIFMAVTLKASGTSLSFSNNLLKWGESESTALGCVIATVLFNGGAAYLFVTHNKEKNKNFWKEFRKKHCALKCLETSPENINLKAENKQSLSPIELFYFTCVVVYATTNPFPFSNGINDGIKEFYKKEAAWFYYSLLSIVLTLSIPLMNYNFIQYWPKAKYKIREHKKNRDKENSGCDIKVILGGLLSIFTYITFYGPGSIMKGTASSMSFAKSCINWGLDENIGYSIAAVLLFFNIGSQHLFFTAKKKSGPTIEFFKDFFFFKRIFNKVRNDNEESIMELSVQADHRTYTSEKTNYASTQDGNALPPLSFNPTYGED